ncbi:MAG TPA: hypothetical protein VLI05_06490 [Candidatus Saccharimonadia bacterium]|nr:hypothetical protein [Candidatus Saccharimonadia bacterium]
MRVRRPNLIRRAIVVAAWAAVALAGLGAAPAALASLSQAYATTASIPDGSLVALDTKSAGSVVVADLTNAGRLFGVTAPPSSALVSLGGSNSSGQVQVITTGTANALVTTSGGDIHVGDAIAVSPIAGVGQKASGKVRIIGTAQSDFSAATPGAAKRTITTATGSQQEVAIGQIPLVVAVATYNQDTSQAYTVPSWLQNFSNALAGKNVSPVRIIIAGLILLISLVSVSVLLYAAVRNSIISIGRNPLSRGSVLRGLLQVTLIAFGILGLAAGAMFLVITR